MKHNGYHDAWVHETGGMVPSSPCITPGGTVYVGSCDSRVYIIAPPESALRPGGDRAGEGFGPDSPAIHEDDAWLIIDNVRIKKNNG